LVSDEWPLVLNISNIVDCQRTLRTILLPGGTRLRIELRNQEMAQGWRVAQAATADASANGR
jgi:hypothetical protein